MSSARRRASDTILRWWIPIETRPHPTMRNKVMTNRDWILAFTQRCLRDDVQVTRDDVFEIWRSRYHEAPEAYARRYCQQRRELLEYQKALVQTLGG